MGASGWQSGYVVVEGRSITASAGAGAVAKCVRTVASSIVYAAQLDESASATCPVRYRRAAT